LARELRDRLGMNVDSEEGRVGPLDDELFDYPFLHMTGHGNVRFTPEETERLRRIFPEEELVELPFGHGVYHSVYDFSKGLPKIHEHHGGPPHGYAIFHEGRMVVFYSYNTDIGDGLEDADVHNDPPDVREQAMRMAINVVAYAMMN
jgi:hypothetical protein